MLKQERVLIQALIAQAAAFGRLCVETHGNCGVDVDISALQPPSGGCVLKRIYKDGALYDIRAAAFGRLCVETEPTFDAQKIILAAAFGRLCVETCN